MFKKPRCKGKVVFVKAKLILNNYQQLRLIIVNFDLDPEFK